MPPQALAVDIGSYSIKMARILPGRPYPQLEHLGAIRTPAGAVQDCEVVDAFAVSEAAKELMAALGVPAGTPCTTAAGGPRVIARAHEVPAMPLAKLRQSVVWEAEKWLPFPVEESVIEPEVVGERTTDMGRVQDVVIVAAPRSAVDSRLEALRLAGLQCVEVDIEPFALMRTLIYGSRDTSIFSKSVAIIRLGGSYSDITIVSRGCYVLSRPLPVAGSTFTKAIEDSLGETRERAEWFKENYGVAGDEADFAGLSSEERRVSAAMTKDMTELARELKLSVSFFQAEFQDQADGANIDQVLLTGGSAMMRGMDAFLTRSLGVEATVVPYFNSLAIDTHRFDPEYVRLTSPSTTIAVGLALAPLMASRQYQFSVDPAVFGVALSKRRQQHSA